LTRPPGKTPREGRERDGEKHHRILVLLGALCFFLSTLEYLIPKPLPFIRIGLANLPLLLALDLLPPRRFALLCLIKIAGGGIIGGTIFSYGFLFSLGGSAASALVMYGLGLVRRRGPGALQPGLAGIGAAGALCSTGVQLLLARFLVFGEAARYLIPPFLAAALITGFGLGLFCEYFRRQSRWYALQTGGSPAAGRGTGPAAGPLPSGPGGKGGSVGPAGPVKTLSPEKPPRRAELNRRERRRRWDSLFDRRELLIAGLPAALLFLCNPSTLGRGGQFLFFWFCAWASGRKNRPLITLLVIAGVVFVNLLAPYGRILAEIGPFSVTTGSLAMGFRRGITLEGLFMLSAVLIRGGTTERRDNGAAGQRSGGAAGRGLGAFRRLLEESLAVFARLSNGGGLIRPGRFVEDLDGLFLGMEDPAPAERPRLNPGKGEYGSAADVGENRRGRPLLALGLLITGIPAVLPVFL
jgi:heptaprenyl diphosphate synthase